MQIWLFFEAGTGGDGIANLIEHAPQMRTLDVGKPQWRVHRIVDGAVKFFAPAIDRKHCFRNGKPFDQTNNSLSLDYLDIVNTGNNCVVTSHDISLNLLTASDCKQIFTKNQLRVLVKTNDKNKAMFNSCTKNLQPILKEPYKTVTDPMAFDWVIDPDQLNQDFDTANEFFEFANLTLDPEIYHQYQQVRKGNREYFPYMHNVQEYTSSVDGNKISYTLKKD